MLHLSRRRNGHFLEKLKPFWHLDTWIFLSRSLQEKQIFSQHFGANVLEFGPFLRVHVEAGFVDGT